MPWVKKNCIWVSPVSSFAVGVGYIDKNTCFFLLVPLLSFRNSESTTLHQTR